MNRPARRHAQNSFVVTTRNGNIGRLDRFGVISVSERPVFIGVNGIGIRLPGELNRKSERIGDG